MVHGSAELHPAAPWRTAMQPGRDADMHPRKRKLAGTIILLVFIVVYALLAMVAAIILQVNASKTVELIYYVVAGLAWVPPAAFIISWMQKP